MDKNKEMRIKAMKHSIKHFLSDNSKEYSERLVEQLCSLNQPIVDANSFKNPVIMEFFSFNRHQYLLEIQLIKDPENKTDEIIKPLW